MKCWEPNPGPPLKWSPYVILGWTILGGIYLIVRHVQRREINLDYAVSDLGETAPDAVPAGSV